MNRPTPSLVCGAAANRRQPLKLRRASARSARESGMLLIECIVYISVWAVITALAFGAFYKELSHSQSLSENAEAISRTLRAGETWRRDVRQAAGPITIEYARDGEALHIPQAKGEVLYVFWNHSVMRRAHAQGRWTKILDGVQSSVMRPDSRKRVTAWRWETELLPRRKPARVRPLFTFEAVAPRLSHLSL